MWRRVTRGLIISCIIAFLATSGFAQSFIGNVDSPEEGATVSGLVRVHGWALSQAKISRIDLYVDDQFQHSANLNLPRIDVVRAYPNWGGIQNVNPGFETGFMADRFSNGPHTIHLVVVTENNDVEEVGTRTVVVDNSVNQAPLGWLEVPGINGGVYNASGSFPVSGWAADTDGIQQVDVLIDGLEYQAATFGDPRPDVGAVYPDFPAAKFSGFVAHVDTTKALDGVHTLTVKATDSLGLSRVIGERTIQIFNTGTNLRPFGSLDEPIRDATLYGNFCDGAPASSVHYTPVRGWALDLGTSENTGRVSYVELLVDGVRWYSTDDCAWSDSFGAYVNCYGFPRFDVSRYYPTYPDAPRAGFMFAMDVGALLGAGVHPGNHTLSVRVGDKEGTFGYIPSSSGIPVFFTCSDSDTDFASLGYIDYPGRFSYLGGTVRFYGWAIDQNAGGVQAVEIWVDGVYVGNAVYGTARTDVRDAYPFISGSFNSGWWFDFDTTQLANQGHRLTVRTMDALGNHSEIGSIDFYTANP